MLNKVFINVRFRIALFLIKRSVKTIEKGGYENIKKGLKYFRWSVAIVPPSKELSDSGKKWKAALNKTYSLNEEG